MPVWLIPKLLFAWGGMKRGASAFGGFLSRHSAWLTVSLVLLACWGIDHVICHRHAAHVEKQLQGAIAARDSYKRQLDAISTAKNKQQVVTRETVKVVTKLVHDADERAKVVEDAPVVAGCKTKPEVLQADL
jgi:hypothetical protein